MTLTSFKRCSDVNFIENIYICQREKKKIITILIIITTDTHPMKKRRHIGNPGVIPTPMLL